MLSVSLLGGMSFSVNGTLVKSDLGPAGRLLACYLFEFSGRLHRRERLADIFWGDAETEKARSALNTAIWRIRKILELGSKGAGRHLVTLGDDVILEPSDAVYIDTHRLENASRRVLNRLDGNPASERDIKDVGNAVESYAGPFLDGYDGDWVLQERERLHCLYVRSTFELMRVAATQGHHERALDFGRRILAIDMLRESVQRDVMLLLVLNGQRAEAIRMYRRLVETLKHELGIDPMPDTQKLHNDICTGKIFESLPNYISAQFGKLRSVD